MILLRPGSRGPDVVKLQLLLASALGCAVRADGVFGPRTKALVEAFQKARRLEPDGVVGPATWAALGVRPAAVPTAPAPVAPGCPWLAIAQAELGVHEIVGAAAHQPRILEYHATTTLKATADETPWCSSFVNWVVRKAGYKGTRSAAAKSWLDWGTALASPRAGAITVIKRKGQQSDAATGSATGFHVGFWVSEAETHVRLLGGNQGDMVKYSSFPTSAYEVRGHRWPSAGA